MFNNIEFARKLLLNASSMLGKNNYWVIGQYEPGGTPNKWCGCHWMVGRTWYILNISEYNWNINYIWMVALVETTK